MNEGDIERAGGATKAQLEGVRGLAAGATAVSNSAASAAAAAVAGTDTVRPPHRTAAALLTIPAVNQTLEVLGYASEGDGGGARYIRVASQPAHDGKLRTADRYLPNGSVDNANGGWWQLAGPHLTLQMFGCDPTGNTDNTQLLRAAFYAACVLDLPIITSGTYKYTDIIYVGSLTSSPAAVNTADGFTLIGNPVVKFRPLALVMANNIIDIRDANGVRVENVETDFTGASHGGHQIRLYNVNGFVARNISKINTGSAFATSGGSILSLRHSSNGNVSHIRCEGAGEFSAASFCDAVTDTYFSDLSCTGGQEIIDFTGCHRNTVIGLRGFSLTGEAFDVGSSSHNNIRGIYVNGCARGISLKTEAPDGYTSEGSNDNFLSDIEIIDYTDYGIYLGGGATSTQTLHRNKVKNAKLRTAVATNTSNALRMSTGDLSGYANSTEGTVFDGVDIDQNAGYWLYMAPMRNFRIANIRSNAPLGVDNQVPSAAQLETAGVFENVIATGPFTLGGLRGYTLRNIKITNGGISLTDPVNVIANNIIVENAPGTGLDVVFSNNTVSLSDKNFHLAGYRNTNNSISTSGLYGLRVRHSSTSGPIEGVSLLDVEIVDTQGMPTSKGVAFGNATFNYCKMIGANTKGVIAGGSTSIAGANSINAANALS